METNRTSYFLSCRPRCDVMCHPEYMNIHIPANLPSPTHTNSPSPSTPSPLNPPSHPYPTLPIPSHPIPHPNAPLPRPRSAARSTAPSHKRHAVSNIRFGVARSGRLVCRRSRRFRRCDRWGGGSCLLGSWWGCLGGGLRVGDGWKGGIMARDVVIERDGV